MTHPPHTSPRMSMPAAPSMPDFNARCAYCARRLPPAAPSEDFCSQEHQQAWAAGQAGVVPLPLPEPQVDGSASARVRGGA
jgi:hypothetical protein